MADKDSWNAVPPAADSGFVKYVATRSSRCCCPCCTRACSRTCSVHEGTRRPRGDPDDRAPHGRGRRVPELHRSAAADMLRLNMAIPPSQLAEPLRDPRRRPRRVPQRATAVGRRRGDRAAGVAGATIPLVDPWFTPDGAASLLTDGTESDNSSPFLAHSPTSASPWTATTASLPTSRESGGGDRGTSRPKPGLGPLDGPGALDGLMLDIGGDTGALVVLVMSPSMDRRSRWSACAGMLTPRYIHGGLAPEGE